MASSELPDLGGDAPPPRPTTPPVRRGFLMVLLALSMAAGLVYGIPMVAERSGYAWESGRSRAASETLARLDKAGVVNRASELFRLATTRVSPAVVNIQTKVYRREADGAGLGFGGGGRFGDGPLDVLGIGSGVIIDRDHGYVVTNNHVIQGADVLTVRLSKGAEIPARLVGADPKTDLAVLQIKAPNTLTVAADWGNSDDLAIGDWVLAIGSPYMLDHTVTAGIISATGRNNLSLPGMDENGYQDFLQTDAAINPGNSGGPLIDLNGRIIGINTAILTANSFLRGDSGRSTGGGFEGIGLAIPSTMAKRVVDGLIANGKVVRGYLGVRINAVSPEVVERLKLKEVSQGALVTFVQPDSPADRAGLRPGDVIVKLGSKEIADDRALRLRTAELRPGEGIAVECYRDGVKKAINVVIGDLASDPAVANLNPYGFRLRQVQIGEKGKQGLVIDQVVPGSPAARGGLTLGLLVSAVGASEVRTLSEFDKAAAAYSPEKGLPLVVRAPSGQTAQVMIGGAPPPEKASH